MGLRLLPRRLRKSETVVGKVSDKTAPVTRKKEITRAAAAPTATKAVTMSDCPGFGVFCVFCDVCTFVRRTD